MRHIDFVNESLPTKPRPDGDSNHAPVAGVNQIPVVVHKNNGIKITASIYEKFNRVTRIKFFTFLFAVFEQLI